MVLLLPVNLMLRLKIGSKICSTICAEFNFCLYIGVFWIEADTSIGGQRVIHLTRISAIHGLPEQIVVDNGRQTPKDAKEYQALTEAELDKLISQLPRMPLLAGEEGIRLSLAGAQSKLPVRMDKEGSSPFPSRGVPARTF